MGILQSLNLLDFPFWLICKVRYRRCCQKNVVFLQLKVGQSYAFHWLYRSNLIQLLCTQKRWFYHFQTYDGQWNGSEKDHMWKTPPTYFIHTWAWDSSDAVWNQTFRTLKEWSFHVPPQSKPTQSEWGSSLVWNVRAMSCLERIEAWKSSCNCFCLFTEGGFGDFRLVQSQSCLLGCRRAHILVTTA